MLELETRGPVTVLRMARGKGNALNVELAAALSGALGRLGADSEVRAVVLTGQGNAFGAGVDLTAVVEGGAGYVRQFLPVLSAAFERLATFPKPVVAAVNGHAIAGGAILMMACDRRLVARGNGRVGLTEVLVGVPFPAWALEIARFAVPPQQFPLLVCSGQTHEPEAALARGLVDELVEPDRLLDRAVAAAEELAGIAPAVFAATKLAVRRPMIEAARQQAAQTDAAVVEQWCLPETLQRVAAFAEKTIKRR